MIRLRLVLGVLGVGILLGGSLGCDRSERYLRQLQVGTAPEQVKAARWFEDHPKRGAVPYLIQGLDSPDFEVRWACARAIAASHDPAAIQRAIETMGQDALSADPQQAQRAIEALGLLGSKALPELMLIATVTPDTRLQVAVRLQIAALAPKADRSERERAARLVLSALEETEPQLYRLAYDLLLFSLLHLRDEVLQAGLRSPDRTVLRSVVRAAGELGDPAAAPLLLPLLDDPDADTRRYVVEALGRCGNPVALQRLEELAKGDPDYRVREAARFAVEQIRHRQNLPSEDIEGEPSG